jgi:hypothetical protein
MLTQGLSISPREMNRLNRRGWKFLTVDTKKKMRDPEILGEAMNYLQADLQLPDVRDRRSFEEAIRQAGVCVTERRRKPTGDRRRDASSLGGQAPREDYLQDAILKILRMHPLMTERELLDQLHETECITVEREIRAGTRHLSVSFTDWNGKLVIVTSIKDRLSRARRKNSR